MITEDRIDTAAYALRSRLEHMLDTIGVRDGKAGEVAAVRVPLCLNTELDFVSSGNGWPIGPTTSPKKYQAQLAVCRACALREQCLNIALKEKRKYGIWGGMMPKERGWK